MKRGDGMAEKADCGSAKAERSGSLHPNQDLLQLGMDSLLFLDSVAIFSTTWVYASMRNGRGRSVSSWTHAAYLF